ncbi:CLUMA_CG010495, isoform A [Clunio marinus]|uniref:CLUMA_CG010495, isoform A n=1 Tax=Clunio marinus TaxID=568069 RepID=A0A1J1IBG8_9DIPT|nr:CLUMA_CG010495, isoform A [Clunio marinus]
MNFNLEMRQERDANVNEIKRNDKTPQLNRHLDCAVDDSRRYRDRNDDSKFRNYWKRRKVVPYRECSSLTFIVVMTVVGGYSYYKTRMERNYSPPPSLSLKTTQSNKLVIFFVQ